MTLGPHPDRSPGLQAALPVLTTSFTSNVGLIIQLLLDQPHPTKQPLGTTLIFLLNELLDPGIWWWWWYGRRIGREMNECGKCKFCSSQVEIQTFVRICGPWLKSRDCQQSKERLVVVLSSERFQTGTVTDWTRNHQTLREEDDLGLRSWTPPHDSSRGR